MAYKFIEPGSDATQDLSFWTVLGGSPVSSTTTARTGARSIKCPTDSDYISQNVLADAGRWISFGFLFDSTILADDGMLCTDQSSGGAFATAGFSVGIVAATQKLWVSDKTFAIVATGNTALSPNTWYRISVAYTITSGAVNTIKVFLNGTLEITATNISVNTACDRLILVGCAASGVNAYFDDIAVTDDSDLADHGDVHVTFKRAFSNGTTNDFSTQIGSGGSGYGSGHAPQVNETHPSTTNGWSFVGAGPKTEEYNIEGLSVGAVDLTGASIKDVVGWTFASSLLSETGKIVVDGTQTNISLTSAPTIFTKESATPTAYPAGSGSDIGIVSDATATTVSLYENGILVAYVPASGSTTNKNIYAIQ